MFNRFKLAIAYRQIFSKNRMLPSAVIMGAQKAGTTSLFAYLTEHPQIIRPMAKEIHFFDLSFNRGIKWYKAHFPNKTNNCVTIEASPYYMFHPYAPERLKQYCPETKPIVLLRDPVQRAFSHFRHNKKKGREDRSFLEAIKDELAHFSKSKKRLHSHMQKTDSDHRHYSYLHRGLYSHQLENIYRHFEEKAVLVMKSESFYANPQHYLDIIYAQSGLAPYKNQKLDIMNQGIKNAELDIESVILMREFYSDEYKQLADMLGKEFRWD